MSIYLQDNKSTNALDDETEDATDTDFLENGRDGLTGTPDSANSRNDKELEEIMEVEHQATAAKTIMHALSIVSAPTSQPGSSPPPLAAVAPHTENGEAWKPHTSLSPKLPRETY
ncbi:hypothetical protein GWI33_002107 [Rhynchophorus ferrugineus]|uniref:Uncharacterized protein n=1 Tax=Rhynchophorus ferrugineus TaxID=354439 RepID=A0A834IS19_RHYFE|nr:hypothetical protein GWI33_002107 [Rhynchophorus ferrugineus]